MNTKELTDDEYQRLVINEVKDATAVTTEEAAIIRSNPRRWRRSLITLKLSAESAFAASNADRLALGAEKQSAQEAYREALEKAGLDEQETVHILHVDLNENFNMDNRTQEALDALNALQEANEAQRNFFTDDNTKRARRVYFLNALESFIQEANELINA